MKTYSQHLRLLGFLLVVILAAGATGARWFLSPPQAGAQVAPQSAAAPAPTDPRSVVCFGHVDMEHGVTALYPLLPGRVTAIEVRENETVKAGTALVRLDDRLAKLRVREAAADLEAARAQLSQAVKLPEQQEIKVAQQRAAIEAVQYRLAGARHQLARKRQLHAQEQLNVLEVSAAEALVKELETMVRAEKEKLRELELNDPSVGVKRAQAEVDAKQAHLEQTRRGEEEYVLRAPGDGTVLRVLVSPGDVLGGLQPRQPAVQFCPNGQRIIRAEVEQEFAGRVAVGQPTSIQDDTSAGAAWRGKVTRISDWFTQRRSILQEPFQFNDVRTVECLIALDPGQPTLRIGQRVRVTIGPAGP